jgi:WD40 repeat protein
MNLAFRADGRVLAVGCQNGDIWLYDPATGKQLPNYLPNPNPKGQAPSGSFVKASGVIGMAYSPVGTRLVTAWAGDATARTWVNNRQGLVLPNPKPVTAVAFSTDGKQIATGAGNEVRLWNAVTGAEEGLLHAPADVVTGLAYHPNGRNLIATGGGSPISSLVDWVWDLETKGPPSVYFATKGWESYTYTFSVLGDGRVPRFTQDLGLTLHDPLTGLPLRVLCPNGVNCSWAPHPNGVLLAVSRMGNVVSLYDTAEGIEILTLRGASQPLFTLAFDPTGRRLAGISGEYELLIWDAP